MTCPITSGLLFACLQMIVSCIPVGTWLCPVYLYCRNIYLIQDCLALQEDLNRQMKFNVAKCHSMRVTWHQHHKQIINSLTILFTTISQHAGPAGDGETQVVSARCLKSLIGHLVRPLGIRPPCFFFIKYILCAVSIEKDKYLTSAHSLKTTRASQCSIL